MKKNKLLGLKHHTGDSNGFILLLGTICSRTRCSQQWPHHNENSWEKYGNCMIFPGYQWSDFRHIEEKLVVL